MNVCPECGARTPDAFCGEDGCPTVSADKGEWLASPDFGRVIAGKYRLIEEVGHGGMGVVYRAWQRDMRRVVALKMASVTSDDEVATRRFMREIQVVAGLTHPNTIRVFDYGQTEDGHLFLTMEFLEGEPLSKAIRRGVVFGDHRVVRIASQVLKSLGEAHRAGIVHRDLSPENIFLTSHYGESDFVKVLDFGVAKAYGPENKDEPLTVQGIFVGKPAYASPEQAEAADELDGRSDLYSLGVIMYQMITGRVPFQSTTPMRVLLAHMREPPPPIQEVAPRPVNPALAALVMRLLAKRKEDRPADAGVALAELARVELELAGTGPVLPPLAGDRAETDESNAAPTMLMTPALARAQSQQEVDERTLALPSESASQVVKGTRRGSLGYGLAVVAGLIIAGAMVWLFASSGPSDGRVAVDATTPAPAQDVLIVVPSPDVSASGADLGQAGVELPGEEAPVVSPGQKTPSRHVRPAVPRQSKPTRPEVQRPAKGMGPKGGTEQERWEF